MINFHKKAETFWVTGVPPITKNSFFLSAMEKFNCKIKGILPCKIGTDEVCFFLTASAEECESAKKWLEENANKLRKDKEQGIENS